MKLLEIAAIEREVALLLEAYPELADDDELRADMLAGSTEVFELLTLIVERMQDADTTAEAIGLRIDQLETRRDRYARRVQAMRDLAERIMHTAGLRKAELPAATLSIRSVAPSVIVTEPDDVPDEFIRIKREVNRAALKDALKAGRFVPGASLSNGTETLAVKVL